MKIPPLVEASCGGEEDEDDDVDAAAAGGDGEIGNAWGAIGASGSLRASSSVWEHRGQPGERLGAPG